MLSFSAPVDVAVPMTFGPYATAAGDFANNGIQDLVVGGNIGEVSVLMGNGNGGFQPAQNYAIGGFVANTLAVGDLNGDGKLDIVAGSNTGVSVLLGNGDGTFQPAKTFDPSVVPPGSSSAATQGIDSIALGDVNHDGRLDVVAAASITISNPGPVYGDTTYDYVDVLVGHGDGTLSLASSTLLATQATTFGRTVALGDFNGDGNLDVAALSGNSVAVLQGNGNGSVAPPTYFATGADPVTLAVGDVNADGKLDLVTANYNNGDVNPDGGTVSVLMGNGDGSFEAPDNIALPNAPYAQSPSAVVVGDLNRDGKMDLAVAATSWGPPHYGPYSTYSYRDVYSNVNVFLGNGQGGFTDAQIVPLNDAGEPSSITAADFNGDAYPDLAVTSFNNNSGVKVLMNEANWSPPPTATSFAVSGFPSTIQAGTPGNFTVTALNPDGTVDTGYTGTVRVSSSDGQAALPAAYTFTATDNGTHTFSATLKTAGTQSITATDTVTGTLTGSETGITVTPAAASHLAVSTPGSSTAGSALSVTVTVLDPYNNTATGYAGAVQFTSSDGQAVLPAGYTFTSADAGVHTFTNAVMLKTAGSQTLTATDTSTGTVTGGASVLVNAAAASTMIVSGFPSPITAGVAGSFTVTLKDAYGNVATGYTGTVHFTSSDAKAVLPANYIFTSADAGKHTFSAALKTAGTQSISATDTMNASLHANDSGITVKPAAASKFVLSAPSSVMPGVPFSLTITVEDAYGNIVTDYVGTVHFSSSDSRAKLPANYTFTAGDNGAHTFTGLVLRKTGYQTITVTDTHNSAISGKKVVDVV